MDDPRAPSMLSIPAILKSRPADFRVTEIPQELAPCPQASPAHPYTYVWVDKSGWTTFDAETRICAFFEVGAEGVGSAGLKDEDGITSQLCSIRRPLVPADLEAFNARNAGPEEASFLRLRSLEGYGSWPIEPRHLHGNRFRIVVRNLDADAAEALYSALRQGMILTLANYYDLQRFGLPGRPPVNHLIGKSLCVGDLAAARRLIMERCAPEDADGPEETVLERINPKLLRFFVDAFNSQRWNEEASGQLRVAAPGGRSMPLGDLFSLWLPDEPGRCAVKPVLEHAAFVWPPCPDGRTARKGRQLLVTTTVLAEPPVPDDLFGGRRALALSLLLPTGCYATMAVRQLLLRFGIAMRVGVAVPETV